MSESKPRVKKRAKVAPESSSSGGGGGGGGDVAPKQKCAVNTGDSDSEEMNTLEEDIEMMKAYESAMDRQEKEELRREAVRKRKVGDERKKPAAREVIDTKAVAFSNGSSAKVQLDPAQKVHTQRLGGAVETKRAQQAKVQRNLKERHDAQRKEPLSEAVRESLKEFLEVYPGEAQRKAYEAMAWKMQEENGQELSWADVPELNARVEKKIEEDARNRTKASRTVQINDRLLTELAEDCAGAVARQRLAEVRARSDADTAVQVKRNTASTKMSSLRLSSTADQMTEENVQRKRARDEATEHREHVVKLVDPMRGKPFVSAKEFEKSQMEQGSKDTDNDDDDDEVQVSEVPKVDPPGEQAGTPELAMPAASTTPAKNTQQRLRVEREVRELKAQNVIVSKASEKAILATSTAPALPVQGRRVSGSNAPVYGDGTLTRDTRADKPHSAAQYMVDLLDREVGSPEELVEKSTDELRVTLQRTIEAYHAASDVIPSDGTFGDAQTVRLLDDRIEHLLRVCYHGKRRMTVSENLKAMQSALSPQIKELKSLRKKLSEMSQKPVHAAVEAALIVKPHNDTDHEITANDVKEAAKRKFGKRWREDDEQVMRAVSDIDITDDDIQALTTSFGADEDKHAFLKQLKHSMELQYFDKQVELARGGEGAVAEHGNLRMRADGERKSIAEDLNEVSEGFIASNYAQSLSNAYRTEHRRLQQTVKTLEARVAQGKALDLGEQHKLQDSRELLAEFNRQAKAETELSKRAAAVTSQSPSIDYARRRAAADLPVIHRQYTKDYLREPLPNSAKERQCVMNQNCICNIAASGARHAGASNVNRRGFVCREFLMPEQEYHLKHSGELPKDRQMCYLCYLYQTQRRLTELMEKGDAGMTMCVINPFRNVFCKNGEYSEHVGNLHTQGSRFYGCVAPIVRFNMENFDYCMYLREGEDGGEYKLHGLEESEDVVFRSALGTTAM